MESTELAVVNHTTGEIIESGWGADFPAVVKNGIQYIGGARNWRADCKAGIFRIGESDGTARTLRMEVMAAKKEVCSILNYPTQEWWELLFVDSDGFVSSMLFKGQSVKSFIEAVQRIFADKLLPTESIITASMQKRSGKEGAYYVLDFKHEANTPERVAEIKNFMATTSIPSRLSELIAYSADKERIEAGKER